MIPSETTIKLEMKPPRLKLHSLHAIIRKLKPSPRFVNLVLFAEKRLESRSFPKFRLNGKPS